MSVDIGYASYLAMPQKQKALLEKADRKMYAERDKQSSGAKELRRSARVKFASPRTTSGGKRGSRHGYGGQRFSAPAAASWSRALS